MIADGTVIDERYELTHHIGVGGSGDVWAATDRLLQRSVAVKIVAKDVDAARLEREARTAARLSHPNVVAVYDAGAVDGRAYLVMELVDGVDLATVLSETGALPPAVVATVASDLSRALRAVHEAGFIHRDVTPGNVLVTADGTVKLTDLGTARVVDADGSDRLTRTGMVVGTVDYLAPEQLADEVLTPAVDVYAAGLVVHSCATARRPFGGGTVRERAARRLTDDPAIPSDAPGWLDTIVVAASQRDAAMRPQDGTALLELVEHHAPVPGPDARSELATRVATARTTRPPTSAGGAATPAGLDDDTDEIPAVRRATGSARAAEDGTLVMGADDASTTAVPATPAPPVAPPAVATDAAAGSPTPTASAAPSPAPASTGDAAATTAMPVVDVDETHREAVHDDGPGGLQWPVILGALLVGAALAVAIAGGLPDGDGNRNGGGGGNGGGNGGDGTIAIVDASDHDPLGGDGEHPDEVANAHDGDLGTTWTTQRYEDRPDLGGLKEGVGLLFDLGEAVEVGSVEVALGIDGVDLEVYVSGERPSSSPRDESSATLLGQETGASGSVEATDGPVEGRWVTVWFTSLGSADGGFVGSVREVTVRP